MILLPGFVYWLHVLISALAENPKRNLVAAIQILIATTEIPLALLMRYIGSLCVKL